MMLHVNFDDACLTNSDQSLPPRPITNNYCGSGTEHWQFRFPSLFVARAFSKNLTPTIAKNAEEASIIAQKVESLR
jgi:hypothetical protein